MSIVDELTFRSYKYNRDLRPDISSARWAAIYGDKTGALEQRYQEEQEVDAVLFLANVLTHLADQKPMTEGDEIAYSLVRLRQRIMMGECGMGPALGGFPDVNTQRAHYAGCE